MGEPADPWEDAACGLITLAPDGTIVRANRTVAAWIGSAAGALEGRPFSSLLTMGSRLFHHTHWLPLLQMQGSVAEVQLELLGPDRQAVPMLVNARKRPDGPVDVGLFVASDRRKYERELLLARRRAEAAEEETRVREAAFRTLAENSPDIIARFDHEGQLVYVNPAAAAFSGVRADRHLGRRADELPMPPDAVPSYADAVARALAGEGSRVSFRYESPMGEFQLEAVLVPERNSDGRVASVLSITRDVSALRRQELEAARRERFAQELMGIVSHDLRNPLNAVLLGAEILRDCDDATRERVVGRVRSAAERASRLIADVLDFTHTSLTRRGLPLALGVVDLHRTVGDTVEELRLSTPDRRIEHQRSGDGEVVADQDRLAQVVTNLVQNALAYGDPHRAIVVSTEVGAATFSIRVHNHGPPIPTALQADIFEPLRRGSEAVRRGSTSVGLGLYIVRQIVDAHGGRVTVQSTADEGTTFALDLPRRAGETA